MKGTELNDIVIYCSTLDVVVLKLKRKYAQMKSCFKC